MANPTDSGKIIARVIIEMLGAPKEHIEATLKDYIAKLGNDKKMEIIKQETAPAEPQEELFSIFTELDIKFDSANKLIDFCLDSMPSSVEILEPEMIDIDSNRFASTLNDLQARIHNNDMIIKTLKAKGSLLDKNAKSVLDNFIKFILKDEPKDLDFISKSMGIKPDHLKPFLNEMIKNGKVIEKEGRYERVK